jgi:hypothetical protein
MGRKHKHRIPHGRLAERPRTAAQQWLEHTPMTLYEIVEVRGEAREQLGLDVDVPPRLVDASPEAVELQARRDRDERAERDANHRNRIVPLGFTPAPLRAGVLEDLAAGEALIVGVADRITARLRQRPDKHLIVHRPPRPQSRPELYERVDHLGYPVHLRYGMRVMAGRTLTHVTHRRDRDPVAAAIRWIIAALPSIVDETEASKVALDVWKALRIFRAIAGYEPLQIRLDKPCFVCGQRSLRLNVDEEYVECRNVACTPSDTECGFVGPHGEPRWYELDWLSARLGISLADQLRAGADIA